MTRGFAFLKEKNIHPPFYHDNSLYGIFEEPEINLMDPPSLGNSPFDREEICKVAINKVNFLIHKNII